MPDPAELFVDEEVPSACRPHIPSALRRAYHTADLTIERNPFLLTPGGRYARGDLIMLAASYELQKLVHDRSLPFDGTWEYFAKPTGKHFVMHTPRARITTSQIADPSKKPRRAEFRENYAERNDPYLFPELEPQVNNNEKRLLHILHGYHGLQFAYLAYPDPIANLHIFRSGNLMRLPHEINLDPDLPSPEGPTESPDPETLENIERHLRDE